MRGGGRGAQGVLQDQKLGKLEKFEYTKRNIHCSQLSTLSTPLSTRLVENPVETVDNPAYFTAFLQRRPLLIPFARQSPPFLILLQIV